MGVARGSSSARRRLARRSASGSTAELAGDQVEAPLEDHGRLRPPRAPVGPGGRQVRGDAAGVEVDAVEAVGPARDQVRLARLDRARRRVGAGVAHVDDPQRHERPVPAGPQLGVEAHAPALHRHEVGRPVLDEAHGTAEPVRGRSRHHVVGDAALALAAEAPADARDDEPHVLQGQPDPAGDLDPGSVGHLGRHVDGQAPVVAGHGHDRVALQGAGAQARHRERRPHHDVAGTVGRPPVAVTRPSAVGGGDHDSATLVPTAGNRTGAPGATAATGSVTAASSSYSTTTASAASSARARSTATTAAIALADVAHDPTGERAAGRRPRGSGGSPRWAPSGGPRPGTPPPRPDTPRRPTRRRAPGARAAPWTARRPGGGRRGRGRPRIGGRR